MTLGNSMLAVFPSIEFRVHSYGLSAEDFYGLFGCDFATCDSLVNGFGFRRWLVAFMFEATDNTCGVAGLFGWGAEVFDHIRHTELYIEHDSLVFSAAFRLIRVYRSKRPRAAARGVETPYRIPLSAKLTVLLFATI